jgi:hypothetical protein
VRIKKMSSCHPTLKLHELKDILEINLTLTFSVYLLITLMKSK